MISLHMRHLGDGRFEVTDRESWQRCKEELEVGAQCVADLKFPRSTKENRLMHGAMKSAYDNQRGGPLFSQEDGGWLRLRAWLLCEAGHCNVWEFDGSSLTEPMVKLLKARDRNEKIYSFWSFRRSDNKILCRTPRSIAFKVLRHEDFQPIKQRIERLLCEVIVPGTTLEQLMEERYVRPKLKRAKPKGKSDKEVGNGDALDTAVGVGGEVSSGG